MLDIQITKTTSPKAKPADESKLGFGKIFTDHMFVMDYAPDKGWHDARIVPYQPFPLDPACVIFHYAQEIFEGLKAYRTADNTIQLFRPDCNGQRMQDSADRMCIPKIPVEDFVQAVKTLVEVDKDWVPHSDGASLYIRPFVIRHRCGHGRPRQPELHVLRHLRSLRRLLCRGHRSRPHLRGGRVHPRRARPDRLHQVRRQLRRLHQGRRDGRAAGLRPGAVAGRRGEEVCGRGRLHEHYVQDRRQDLHRPLHRYSAARRHPPLHHRTAEGLGL